MFVWLAAPGRFTSLFFRAHGLSDTQVGILMALVPLVSSLCGPALALIADRAEASRAPLLAVPYWKKKCSSSGRSGSSGGRTIGAVILRGHEGVLALSVLASTACFLLFAVVSPAPPAHSSQSSMDALPPSTSHVPPSRFAYFVVVRLLYSFAMAPMFGVLDGLALRRLSELGRQAKSYGQERLYGAYGWAVSSLLFGVCSDLAAPEVAGILAIVYPFMCAAALLAIGTLAAFAAARENDRFGADADAAGARREAGSEETTEEATRENRSADGTTRLVLVGAIAAPTEEEEEEEEEEEHDEELEWENRTKEATANEKSTAAGFFFLSSSSSSSSSSSFAPSLWERRPNLSLLEARRAASKYASALSVLCRAFFAGPLQAGFVFCTVVLTAGTSIVENLLFLFFAESLGATATLCGLSVVVTVVFEIPIFARAGDLLDRCGAARLLCVACAAYAVRVVGYTAVPNPWFVLCLEPLHGVTYSCLKTAATHFVAVATPRAGPHRGLDATAQNLMGAITGLFGSLLGTSVGGYVQDQRGPHVLYRGAGALVLVSVAVFGILAAVDVEGSATIRSSGNPSRETRRQRHEALPQEPPDDVDEESTALPAVPCATNELGGGNDGDPTKEIEWVVGGDGSLLRSQCSEHREARRDVEKEANAAGESDQQSADYLRKPKLLATLQRDTRGTGTSVTRLTEASL